MQWSCSEDYRLDVSRSTGNCYIAYMYVSRLWNKKSFGPSWASLCLVHVPLALPVNFCVYHERLDDVCFLLQFCLPVHSFTTVPPIIVKIEIERPVYWKWLLKFDNEFGRLPSRKKSGNSRAQAVMICYEDITTNSEIHLQASDYFT